MRKIVFDIETSAYPFESPPLDISAAAIVSEFYPVEVMLRYKELKRG